MTDLPPSDAGASPLELPPQLEERLFSIHFDLAAEERSAAFDALIAEEPAHESGLRRAMQRLAGADAVVGDVRNEALQSHPHENPEPPILGNYQIVRRLGEGGMGVVYLAEQSKPVRRHVALKVIKLGMDTRRVLARFEIERQSLAMMNHEHIARVFDAGTTEAGQPFFVMEFVDGVPITRHCDDRALDTEARLRLFAKVCAGVQHAHQKGIVHRDIKPSNILVATQDGEGVPKIIDFGLARATDRETFANTLFTEEGVMVGTPEYMSPEQTGSGSVDTRTDIYSLGVVLYELLVGELPIEPGRADLIEAQRIIRDDDPVLPSRRVSTSGAAGDAIAIQRSTSVGGLHRALRGDLDWIVLKAIDKDADRRYPTANALLSDVQRHLAHEPVSAGPPGAAYRVRKFVRRNRGRVAAATALLVVLIGGSIGTTLGLFEAREAESREKEARADAELNLARYDQLRHVVLLREAREAIPGLYPERPQRAGAMQAWIDRRAEPLVAKIPELRAARAELLAGIADGDELTDAGDRFLDGALDRLIANLARFADPKHGEVARVRESLSWALRVEAETIDAHAGAWREAAAAIAASQLYRGLEIHPQIGLIPIGMDRQSRLWEFAHPRSGRVVQRDSKGVLQFEGDCGLVFVLVPGGVVRVGAQATDEALPNYYQQAEELEGPVYEVDLAPFFVSKFEMTQGQWQRLNAGANPSHFKVGQDFPRLRNGRGTVTAAHPVEQVSWSQCRELLDRHSLDLPTSAQWEYACRAGADTPWWTGRQRETLRGAVNIADRSGGPFVPRAAALDWPDFEDGWPVHAPVHTMRPNPFGLHNVHGNVWEWCRDRHNPKLPPRPGDGLRPAEVANRAHRGGGFMNAADQTRASKYANATADGRWSDLGLRPTRPLQRE